MNGDVYRRIRGRAKTLNQLNGMIVAMENIITVDEVDDVIAEMTTSFDSSPENELTEREREWCAQVEKWKSLPGFETPHHFVRLWNRPSASLYVSAQSTRKTPRRLMVCFTGGFRRMMMPTWMFLSLLPHEPVYVLMLRATRGNYNEGLPGISTDMTSTMTWVSHIAKKLRAKVDVVSGASAGANPALVTGAVLGARTRILFGLPHLRDSQVRAEYSTLSKHPNRRDVGRGLTLVVGADEGRDVATSVDASTVFPRVAVVTVPEAGHTVAYNLVERGEFHLRMRQLMGASRWRWFG